VQWADDVGVSAAAAGLVPVRRGAYLAAGEAGHDGHVVLSGEEPGARVELSVRVDVPGQGARAGDAAHGALGVPVVADHDGAVADDDDAEDGDVVGGLGARSGERGRVGQAERTVRQLAPSGASGRSGELEHGLVGGGGGGDGHDGRLLIDGLWGGSAVLGAGLA
jgi:hypothetical protein